MKHPTIHTYVKEQEANFETDQIRLGDNWNWNFRDHVQLIFHLKNGVFYTGENDYLRSFKNIMEPLLNLAYWTEDIEVKDVVFYIEGNDDRVLSFLIKKYHDEVYVKEHDLDTLFDEITESDLDYGGALVQRTSGKRPELVPLQSIAFCDQTDIMGGPIGFKHFFSPDSLRRMAKNGWGEESNGATISIEELITLADDSKAPDGILDTKENQTPGKVIEIFIVLGPMPEAYLLDNDNMEDIYDQVQVIAFYTDKRNKKQGVTLYRKKATDDSLFFHTSKKVHNRALGRGVGESLIHPQIWTNFLTIHKMNMLEAASKVPLYTDDPSYTQRNRIQDMENLEITTVEEGKRILQVPTAAPANLQLMDVAINEWFEHSQLTASAQDPILGKEPVAGTTFRGQERTVAQGRGLHDRRKGQRAKFIEILYRELIIPDMVKEIRKGKKFFASLSLEEMQWVAEQLTNKYINSRIKDALFSTDKEIPSPEDIESLKGTLQEGLRSKGGKFLLEIMKGELEDAEIRMGINIANKQKDLVNLSDKLLSVFQYVFANPQAFQQAMQIPALAKSFQDILEYSGLNQSDFASLLTPPQAQLQAPQPQQQPQQPMNLNQQPA